MTVATESAVRPYCDTDVEGILSLVEAVQPHVPYRPERWRWEYPDLVRGPGLAWVLERDGRIVSHIGMLPFAWWIDGERSGAFLHVDAMTHPDWRGHRLHARLTEVLLEHFHASGLPFSYVFPNDNSRHQLDKLRWRRVDRIPLLARDAAQPASRVAPADVDIHPVARFGPEVDALAGGLAEAFRFALVRDHAWLNWRFADKPDDSYAPYVATRHGRVVGELVFKLHDEPGAGRRGHLVDLWTAPDDVDAAVALIRHALRFGDEARAAWLSCWMLPHAPAWPLLQEHGFQPRPVERFLYAHASRGWGRWEELADPTSWYVTMADSDVY